MATQPRYPTFVLKMNINCCKACPKKFKKWMEKTTGVISVGINPAKKLVYVTGNINPQDLIEKIHKKSNRRATLVEEYKPNINHDQNHANNDRGRHNHGNGGGGPANHGGGRGNDHSSSDDDTDCDDGSTSCCSQDTRNRGSGGGHKAEAYVPSPSDHVIDEEICRDKFCLNHPRNSIIRNGVPLPYMQQHPFSHRGPMLPPFSSFRPPPPPYGMRMPPPAPYPAYAYNRSRLPFSWM